MPKRIGKYEITAEIGRGGFSRVYRGFDPNVNRPVAVKVSNRESDPEHLSRFRNEASSAGNLRHENIVTIYDYGDDDGVPYLVMELLEGRDLHHIMRDGPKLSLLQKMQVMSQVGEGLRCAHSNGVVHRDIKPANVMMLADGTVKILDFGIARMTGEVSRLTQNGYLVGTPLYMSPEQLQGGDADALCDVWAYGVLYFELLTGQHPFLSQDNTRLIRNITIVNPPSVHSLTRGVPEGLAQVIRRALTKDRRRRYQSVEEALVDTNPILALLQREHTTGLVSEAQFYRSSGQLTAARQTSRRALEIDPGNYAAQQLLKAIQHEIMQAESLAAPEERSMLVAATPPPPPAPVRLTPPVAPPAVAKPDLVKPVPVLAPPPATRLVAPVVAAPVVASVPVAPAAADTPPSTPRQRPALASGAAAAIAAAVAAAKARQAEEENEQKESKPEENQPEEQTSAPEIKAAPLVVSALPTSRPVPTPQPAASLKRAENGSGVFVTDDPLVVKRPAAAVMTQRMQAADAAAAVATPTPAPPPPTRLPGTKAIPASVPRVGNGTAEVKTAASLPVVNESGRVSENLPMRRPPSEVYAKSKRRNSGSIFVDKQKQKKPFPWAPLGFVAAVALAGAALVMFALSAPKLVNTPVLQPDKLTFTWKEGTPKPQEQILNLKGGAVSSSFTAASSDEEWLSVTPASEEASNRSWRVKVDPEKVGPTGLNGTSGWIDVTSTEGFKTQEEVIVKVGAADAVVPAKVKKTPLIAPKEDNLPAAITTPVAAPTPAVKKPVAAPPLTEKGTVAANSSATSAKTVVGNKPAVPAAKPAITLPPPTAAKKQPLNDGVDIN